MNYRTTDELMHFQFKDAYIADIQVTSGFFHILLDNVTILPENSCNRDIREMRANQLTLKLEEGRIISMIEEGYKVYDANGNLKDSFEDKKVAEPEFAAAAKNLVEGTVFSLEKKANQYIFLIDGAEEGTYQLVVEADHDVEEWDRFLNK